MDSKESKWEKNVSEKRKKKNYLTGQGDWGVTRGGKRKKELKGKTKGGGKNTKSRPRPNATRGNKKKWEKGEMVGGHLVLGNTIRFNVRLGKLPWTTTHPS